ncbi:MAG: chloride channel protein, partial [Nitrospirae bacterium]
MFLSSLMVRYLAPEAVGHGTEKVIEAVHRKAGKISLPVIPVKFTATIVTLATGGSVGKEGPCAQIGGGVASLFADILRFDDRDRRKLVICGISAGFSTVFGTPIAGAIFGIEV